jgi:copper homeostasis protein
MSSINPNILVEVCVDSVASALAAQRGGAGRVELCSGLMEGGVTPSAGLIEAVRTGVSNTVHVMIRPRGGDFFYDKEELAIMRRDIAVAKRLGADGVVLGILDLDGNIDVARTRELVELARPLAVTFHRAFDMAADLSRALEDICATGATRLLTSGGEQTSLEGRDQIARLVQQAGGRVIVMPGSGIKPENARSLIERTGAREIHVGLRSPVPSPMRYRNQRVSMGSVAGREYERQVVLEESVRKLCAALEGAS